MSLKKSLPNNHYADRPKAIFYWRTLDWVFGWVAFRQNAKRRRQKSYQSYSKKDGECFNYAIKKVKLSKKDSWYLINSDCHLFLMLLSCDR